MPHILFIVTGAPGAGKSTAVEAFMQLNSAFLAFDIDWLTVPASQLVGKDIIWEPSTWKPYGAVWFEVLHAIDRNGKVPVFFAPTSPQDIEQDGKPAWCREIAWLLLDCDDGLRQQRLEQRAGWTEAMVAEAIEDAAKLRQTVRRRIDTGVIAPRAVARMIHEWLLRSNAPVP